MNKIILITLICSFNIVFSQKTDTLRVYQNDTLIFKKKIVKDYRDDLKYVMHYELITPIDSTYYFIFNNKKQLVKEGEYTSSYTYEGMQHGGGFYNVKYYYYNTEEELRAIAYIEDGRHSKTEHYKGGNELIKVKYIDKKTQVPVKVEFYKNNKLKKTKKIRDLYTYTSKEKTQ